MAIREVDGQSSDNIQEIFGSFTFNLLQKEVRRKMFQKVKERDVQVSEMTKDDVLFKKNDEDTMLIATTSTTLTQDNVHNIVVLNEKLTKAESKNKKIEEEDINLKVKMDKK